MTEAPRSHPRTELVTLAADTLRAVGARPDDAELVAHTLVSADARGIHSHGLLRLPLYVEAVEAGGILPQATPTWVRDNGTVAVLDGGSGFGQVIMQEAVRKASTTAHSHGMATIAIHHGTHYGAGAFWTDQLAEEGLIALLTSTTGASVAPYGSAEAFIGTNPLSISFPTTTRPITADMATSSGAYGKVIEAARAGRRIPEGWAVDSDGLPTTDARAAAEGALIPFGGHKGSAIAVLVELLAGAGGDGNFAHETVDIWNDRSSRIGTGALLIAIDAVALHGDGRALIRAEGFRERLTALRPARGIERVLAPGDPEHFRGEGSRGSITIPAHVDDAIRATHQRVIANAS